MFECPEGAEALSPFGAVQIPPRFSTGLPAFLESHV
jgi:hypothetical protein